MLNTAERTITWGDPFSTNYSATVSKHSGGEWLLLVKEYDEYEIFAELSFYYPTEDQAIRAAEALAGLCPNWS